MNCQWCGAYFGEVKSRQIYCSESCRTEATKVNTRQRIMQQKAKERQQNPRVCKGCGAVISIYRNANYCSVCEGQRVIAEQLKIMRRKANEKPFGS